MTNSYIDKESGYPHIDPFQQIMDKVDSLRGELDELKTLMHIKEKTANCAFCADETPTRSRSELIGDLDYMIKTWKERSSPETFKAVTNADHLSLMQLISTLFKAS